MIGFIQKSAEKYVTDLLAGADVRVNGARPWDIQVKNSGFFDRISFCGSIGLGESYMDGWWECEALDQFFFKLLHHGVDRKIRTTPPAVTNAFKALVLNCQSRRKAFEVGEKHYDAGNDLFKLMLDRHMAYSCGYWKKAENLNQAQEAKLEMICRKLLLAPGMRLLDIGCGWGSLVRYAVRNYGVSAVGLTISREQAVMARERCADLPVEIRLQDYRETEGTFDAVVSVGMFEHVGYKNYRTFMEVVRRCLKEDGLFLLHTIAANNTVRTCDPWFDKYIFPNGMLPSIKHIGSAIEQQFIMEDWHNFGVDYDLTLMAWHKNFERSWDRLKTKYSERFYRMWRYYLLSLAGGFRARNVQLWQVVMSPNGSIGGYPSLRCPECIST
ncbi:MAG: cyclopropane fatty acyl phospholipid synthase [Desulfobulbaceae bacterium]|nr:cyclopropane fatty acyl phospholipid synthase [Desulfobulbaceae bacterium]